MRRSRCHFALLALGISLHWAGPALAQDFPSGPVRFIVSLSAGGVADVITRAVGERLGRIWKQPLVIENRTGAGTNIAGETVARAEPDGYTLLSTSEATLAANPFMYTKLRYDPRADLIPVTGLGLVNQLLVVHPSTKMKTVADFVAAAKARPGELTYGTFGIGSSGHLNMELLMLSAGIKLTPVHYRGAAPAVTDLIGGHIKAVIVSTTLSQGPWKAGQIVALGAGSLKRLPQYPELPTIVESGVPGFRAVAWFGFYAPAGTPKVIIDKINADVQQVLADPEFKTAFLDRQQIEPIRGNPSEFAGFVKSEQDKWQKVIKTAGIKIQ